MCFYLINISIEIIVLNIIGFKLLLLNESIFSIIPSFLLEVRYFKASPKMSIQLDFSKTAVGCLSWSTALTNYQSSRLCTKIDITKIWYYFTCIFFIFQYISTIFSVVCLFWSPMPMMIHWSWYQYIASPFILS